MHKNKICRNKIDNNILKAFMKIYENFMKMSPNFK